MNLSGQLPLLLPILAGLVGGFVRGFSGFGFGMAAVPILMVGTPPVYVIPAVLILEVAIGVVNAPGQRKSVAWDKLKTLMLGSLVGTPIGLALLSITPATTMRPFIGFTILLSVIVLWMMPRPNIPLSATNLGLAGVTSGLLNGSTAASGPPAIILLFASDTPPNDIRSLLIFFILASAAIAIAISAISGLVVWPVIEIAALLVPGVIVGSLTGNFLFNKLHTRFYRKISLAILFAVTLVTLALTLMPTN